MSYAANMETYDNMKRRNPSMSEAMRLFMKEELEEERNEGRLEEKKEMAINLNASGVSLDIIAHAAGVTADVVRSWLGMKLA